ncbi:TlpA disulfide reductase family protein [Granulicella sp. L60]|jgi:thiol-disulfide isomerase/thioredoxin|uniref:TlpA disulfide reductase family protein n=1 Tax=Granulicella sp. L60 TaxID=1641866 RepID=UPI00131AB3B1|nr:TlpA disulfide reductase family protein [Granulicella sp. L60]
MKLFASVLALSFSALPAAFAPSAMLGQTPSTSPILGIWQGNATVRDTQQVPITIRISGSGSRLKAEFLNGPADYPDSTPASSVTFDGAHLVASFDYFARTLEATITDGKLSGTYGPAHPTAKSAPTPFTATRGKVEMDPASAPNAPDISGSWEIATKSSKGESAWEFRADPPKGKSPVIKTVIQQIDGDTGGLWGTWNGSSYIVGHFDADGPALYSVTPQTDGTLLINSLLANPHAPTNAGLIARRPTEARKENLAAPTDPTQQTTVKDPNTPLAFSFPDLNGKIVSNTDPEFRGKVVIVAVGGSWCPNCHDEAPFLVNLYKQFHSKGLEIVNLDFEQGDPDTDTARLKAFIAHYGISYPVLAAGTTDQLSEKIPQGVNLNCWPTSFFIGRDGLVKEVHAGFAGPGNTAGHVALEHDVTEFVEKLLAQPAPSQTVSITK